MRVHVLSLVSLVLLASQALALTEERKALLYDTLSLALRCDAASGLLRKSLAKEREQVRAVWTEAGMELGMAMINGEVDDPDPGYGRRCLTRFNFPPTPDYHPEAAAFSIGFSLGEARACFAEHFRMEASSKVPTGSLLGGDTEQEQRDRENLQAFAREEFNSLGCNSISFPAP